MKSLLPRHLVRGRGLRTTRLFLSLVLGLVPVMVCAQAPSTGSLSGQVINGATRTPLAGAAVVQESDPRIRAFTEADGSFRLQRVPAGEQGVLVEYTGLDAGRARAAVPPGGDASVVVRLSAGIYRLEAFIFQGIGTRPTNVQYYGVRLNGGISGRF